jgi:hypothetical protein
VYGTRSQRRWNEGNSSSSRLLLLMRRVVRSVVLRRRRRRALTDRMIPWHRSTLMAHDAWLAVFEFFHSRFNQSINQINPF